MLVTNPQVADAVLRSPRRIYVMGLQTGATDAAFFDGAGRRILALNIRVDQDFGAVAQTISRLIPDAHVQVEAANNGLILSGQVANATEADQAVQIAQQFTASPAQVVNMMSIAGKEQVMLKVRIVEMQRSVIKQLGFNLNALVGQAGGPQFLLGDGRHLRGERRHSRRAEPRVADRHHPPAGDVAPSTRLTGKNDLPGGLRRLNNGGQASIATNQNVIGLERAEQGLTPPSRPSSRSAWCARWPSPT